MSACSTWKKGEFVDITADVESRQQSINIEEKRVKVSVGSARLDVYYQQSGPSAEPAKDPPVLLLHGMSFKSQTWHDLGTLTFIGAVGHRAVAIDLPGFGQTPASNGVRSDKEHAEFLANFIADVGLDKPVIVSPSMSGSFALPYLLGGNHGPASALSSGYIPVAPVGTSSFHQEDFKKCDIPVAIVYGERDAAHGSLRNLPYFPNKETFCFQDAGHACYMNQPKLWHKTLYNFLTMISE